MKCNASDGNETIQMVNLYHEAGDGGLKRDRRNSEGRILFTGVCILKLKYNNNGSSDILIRKIIITE